MSSTAPTFYRSQPADSDNAREPNEATMAKIREIEQALTDGFAMMDDYFERINAKLDDMGFSR
ncbi:hypothetical protein ITP53_25935 [Nonomuraea sp. K274]|uniref:Uncharacterized protein n=1 Tax=Nonomuraea cypriaca TaxID=1187855 RepID=A0A931F2J6_9ACTN|nr:hypothetical protein [Nonomuraea cypriaca]MBF8189111.1 hypothetical protein [Nonomuraea cypriaca]